MKANRESRALAAIVLAAGLSSRMKENKLLLPWKNSTVIGWVVSQLVKAGMRRIFVVTGRDANDVESLTSFPGVKHIYNKLYADGEMLHSLQAGLKMLPGEVDAALVVLGDQPQIEIETIQLVARAFEDNPNCKLILPSFQNRRGHPWIVARELWDEIISMEPPDNLRTFLQRYSDEITYVLVNTTTIFADIDTPQDYQESLKH
ncbi:MAG: nucleotidyltransferase family protein [bacterium]